MTSAYDHGRVPPIEMRHRLRIAREYADMDQRELALRMGVTRSTISNCEAGKVNPQRTTINLWALACGVPATWITTGMPPANNPDGGSGLGIISNDFLAKLQVADRKAAAQRPRAHAAA